MNTENVVWMAVYNGTGRDLVGADFMHFQYPTQDSDYVFSENSDLMLRYCSCLQLIHPHLRVDMIGITRPQMAQIKPGAKFWHLKGIKQLDLVQKVVRIQAVDERGASNSDACMP